MPVTAATQLNPGGGYSGYYANMTAVGAISGTIASATTNLTLRVAGATGTTDLADTNFNNTTNLYMMGCYYSA